MHPVQMPAKTQIRTTAMVPTSKAVRAATKLTRKPRKTSMAKTTNTKSCLTTIRVDWSRLEAIMAIMLLAQMPERAQTRTTPTATIQARAEAKRRRSILQTKSTTTTLSRRVTTAKVISFRSYRATKRVDWYSRAATTDTMPRAQTQGRAQIRTTPTAVITRQLIHNEMHSDPQ